MFTGIVEELGEVVALDRAGAARSNTDDAVLRIHAPGVAPTLRPGESIAVNGVCLTALAGEGTETGVSTDLAADVMAETFLRTNLERLAPGDRVNLERARVLGDRLDGHIVQGHVDGTGVVIDRGEAPRHEMRVSLPDDLARYVAPKGSIAVDGVSLTVVEANDHDFTVCLIPTTLAVTTLGLRQVGDEVNLEVDVLAKYLGRLLETGAATTPDPRSTPGRLSPSQEPA